MGFRAPPAGEHRDPGDPVGPCRDQADPFLVSQEPPGLTSSTLAHGVPCFGGCWPPALLVMRRSSLLLSRSLGQSGLASPPRSLACPASAWVALGGAGLQDPEPCLCSERPPPPCRPPLPPGTTHLWLPRLTPAKFPRGGLIRRALAPHSWVWFFAVSRC